MDLVIAPAVMTRRSALKAGGLAAAAGIVTIALPEAAAASSNGMPFITLTPNSGADGIVVTIAGGNFSSNSTLSATFDGSPITLTPTAPVSGPVGDVPTSPAPTFTVPAGATVGVHTVVVSDAIGGAGHTASATYTVTSPIDFVGVGPTQTYTGNNNSKAVAYPSGTAAGDLLLVICSNSHEENPPTPTGSFGTWASAAAITTTVGGHGALQVFWKFAQAGETSVNVVSPSNAKGFNACVVAYRNVNATTPLDGVTPTTRASLTDGLALFIAPPLSTGSSNALRGFHRGPKRRISTRSDPQPHPRSGIHF